MYIQNDKKYLIHYNHFHDALGRFASGMGSGNTVSKSRRIKRYEYEKELKAKSKKHTKNSAKYANQVRKTEKAINKETEALSFPNVMRNTSRAFDAIEKANNERFKANDLAKKQRASKKEVDTFIKRVEKEKYQVVLNDRYTTRGLSFANSLSGVRVYDPTITVFDTKELKQR